MDRKNIERPKNFNQRAYNDQYQKDHYSSFAARVKPDLKQEIDDYCKDQGISKSEFLRRSLDALKELDK